MLALTTLALCGCANVYCVQVNARSDPALAAGQRTYLFARGNKDARATDLLFGEMASNARAALGTHGYVESLEHDGAAGLRTEVSYGMVTP